jgi:hypothetical protein
MSTGQFALWRARPIWTPEPMEIFAVLEVTPQAVRCRRVGFSHSGVLTVVGGLFSLNRELSWFRLCDSYEEATALRDAILTDSDLVVRIEWHRTVQAEVYEIEGDVHARWAHLAAEAGFEVPPPLPCDLTKARPFRPTG